MVIQTQHVPPGKRDYSVRDFTRLVGTRGFSEQMLRTHFELYEGYVKHTNKALELLREPAMDAYAAAEIRRRLVWEFNGMRLHEFYFEALTDGGKTSNVGEPLQAALRQEFGSVDDWMKGFQALATLRGSGWAVLCYDPRANRLIHDWVNEHDRGLFAGTFPIIVLDLFEHAYMRDYGTDRKAYLQAYWNALDWSMCETRLRNATQVSSGPGPGSTLAV